MAEPGRTWLDRRVDLLQQVLGASEMDVSTQDAAEMITDWVQQFAAGLGVTEVEARPCVDGEFIANMAYKILFDRAEEQPGADLLAVPRTVPLARVATGMLVTALSYAVQIHAAHEPTEYARQLFYIFGREMSEIGLVIAEAGEEQPDGSEQAMFPPALLRRAARHVRRAAELLAEDDGNLTHSDEAKRDSFAEYLHYVADKLIELVGSALPG